MPSNTIVVCSDCGIPSKYYDKVSRIVRTRGRRTKTVTIKRYRCPRCRRIRRDLPDYIFPYKQYDSEVIIGVIENLITCDTFGFEDYPCEATMARWKTLNLQSLL